MIHVTDTHPVVWFLERNPRLGANAKTILADPKARLTIPAIVLAEIHFLYARRRIGVDVRTVLAYVFSAANCIVYLNQIVVEFLPTSLEIHDAIIVATALVFRDVLGEQVAIIPKDQEITNFGAVPTVWRFFCTEVKSVGAEGSKAKD